MPKGAHLKGKGGLKFGEGQDTSLGGRKKSYLNEVWKIVLGTDSTEEERTIILAKDDKYKLIESIFEMPVSKLQEVANNEKTPAFILNIITAIIGDIEERKTFTIDKYFDRFFGKASQPITGGSNEEGENLPIEITLNLGGNVGKNEK